MWYYNIVHAAVMTWYWFWEAMTESDERGRIGQEVYHGHRMWESLGIFLMSITAFMASYFGFIGFFPFLILHLGCWMFGYSVYEAVFTVRKREWLFAQTGKRQSWKTLWVGTKTNPFKITMLGRTFSFPRSLERVKTAIVCVVGLSLILFAVLT